jgi:hypothetical protein
MRALTRTGTSLTRASQAVAAVECDAAGRGADLTRAHAHAHLPALAGAPASRAAVTVPSRGISTAEQDYLYGQGGEDPKRRPKVDARITAMQVMGSESAIRADAAPMNSAAERRVTKRLDWLREKLSGTVYYSSLSTAQVEDLDEAFESTRFAAPIKVWHDIMNVWLHWGSSPEGDPAEAARRVDGYLSDLLKTTSVGVWALSREGRKSSPYPENMLRFSLRPDIGSFHVAMRAHSAAGNAARVRELFDTLLALRSSIPDPAAEPAPALTPGPEMETALLRRRLNAQHRSSLAPSAATYAVAMRAALRGGDHAFLDATVAQLLTRDRALTLTQDAHLVYMESLARRGLHLAVVEYLRAVLLHQQLRSADADLVADDTAGGMVSVTAAALGISAGSVHASASTAIPSWLLAPVPSDTEAAAAAAAGGAQVARSPFPPARAHWLLAFESLLSLHTPTDAERSLYGLPASFPASARATAERHHALPHRAPGAAPRSVPELDPAARQWLYDKLAAHGVPVEAAFYQAMLAEAPTPAHVVSYVNDLHGEADALYARARAEPPTAEEAAAERAERDAQFKLVVNLAPPQRDAAFRRTFGRYADAAAARGVVPSTYETVHTRLVDLLVFELGRASADVTTSASPDPAALRQAFRQSIEAYAEHLKLGVLSSSAAAKQSSALATATTAPAALATGSAAVTSLQAPASMSAVAVRPPAVPHRAVDRIFGSSSSTATLLSLAGSPAASQLLEHVMAVRKAVTAYGVETTDDANTAYVRALVLAARRGEPLPPLAVNTSTSVIPVVVAPVRVRVRAAVEGEPTERVLVTVRDRVQYAHANIVRRHAQLSLVVDELEMLSAAGATLDLELYCELVEAMAELGTDAALLRGPFDVIPGSAPQSEDVVDESEAGLLSATAEGLEGWVTGEMQTVLGKMTSRALVTPPAALQHVSLLEASGAVGIKTYLPLLRVLAAHGSYEEFLRVVTAAHEHRGLVPTREVFNLLVIACVNGNAPGPALRTLDLMAQVTAPGQLATRALSASELSRAITAGTTAQLVAERLTAVSEVFPDEATLSLLLRALYQKGLLQHVEELWRRLAHRPISSWTSYSAVEEQAALAEALADHTTQELEDVELGADAEALLQSAPSASADAHSEDEYSDAFNPSKSALIRRLQTVTPDALKRPLRSLLTEGARRPLPVGTQLLLDAPADAAVAQTFIQLGHPLHALQLYLDARAGMPARPLPDPSAGALAGSAQARDTAAAKMKELSAERAQRSLVPNANLNAVFSHNKMGDASGKGDLFAGSDDAGERFYSKSNVALIDVSRILPSTRRVPLPREREARRISALASSRVEGRVRPRGHDASAGALTAEPAADGEGDAHPLLSYYWPQADLLASVVLYYQRSARATVTRAMDQLRAGAAEVDGERAAPTEVVIGADVAQATLRQAETVVALTQRAMSELRDFALSHPYVLGDGVTDLLYGTPRVGSLEEDMRTCVFSRPALVVPFIDATAELYRTLDELALAATAMEESLFKARAAKHSTFGLKRWFAIFPAVANQARALLSAQSRRDLVQGRVDRLRKEIDASIRRSLRERRDTLRLQAHERALTTAPKTDADSAWIARFSQFLGVQDADAVADIFLPAQMRAIEAAEAEEAAAAAATAAATADPAGANGEDSGAAAAEPSAMTDNDRRAAAAAAARSASSRAPPSVPDNDPLAELMAALTASNAPVTPLSQARDVWSATAIAAASGAMPSAAGVGAGGSAAKRDMPVWNPLGADELPIPLADRAASAALLARVERVVATQRRVRADANFETSHTENDAVTQSSLFLDVREPSLNLQPLRAEGVFYSPYGPTGHGGVDNAYQPKQREGVTPAESFVASVSSDEKKRRARSADADGMYVEESAPREMSPLLDNVAPRPLDSRTMVDDYSRKYKSGRLAAELDSRPTPRYNLSEMTNMQMGSARTLTESQLDKYLLDSEKSVGMRPHVDKPMLQPGLDLDDKGQRRRVAGGEQPPKTGIPAFRDRSPARKTARDLADATRTQMLTEFKSAAQVQSSLGSAGWPGAGGNAAPRHDRAYDPVSPFSDAVRDMRSAGRVLPGEEGQRKTKARGAAAGASSWASAAASPAFEQIRTPKSKVMKVKEKLAKRNYY